MINVAILDDEPRGSWLMEQKLKNFGNDVVVKAIYHFPAEALKDINQLNIDVLFLDVEMPLYTGFQFLEKLGEFNFEVIFTTAYDKYILDALHLSAVDYLLKPISEQSLETAITRLKKRIIEKSSQSKVVLPQTKQINNRNKLALPTAEGIHLVDKSSIIRIEALSNYSAFILSNGKKIIVSHTLKEYDSILQDDNFFRVNRSIIVNLDYAVKYKKGEGGILELSDGFEADVSPQKKEELITRLF